MSLVIFKGKIWVSQESSHPMKQTPVKAPIDHSEESQVVHLFVRWKT